MHEGLVQDVCQNCSTCGFGPVRPREEQSVDRFTRETIIEAVWICQRCGNRFAQGIVRRIPADEKK
jgi:hypothetical protein